jgi:hypothetical protein
MTSGFTHAVPNYSGNPAYIERDCDWPNYSQYKLPRPNCRKTRGVTVTRNAGELSSFPPSPEPNKTSYFSIAIRALAVPRRSGSVSSGSGANG